MVRENTAASHRRQQGRAHGLHLAVSHAKVTSMSSTTPLRVVPRTTTRKHHVSATATQPQPHVDLDARRKRNSLIRMGIAAATAPGLWLVHALAMHWHRGF